MGLQTDVVARCRSQEMGNTICISRRAIQPGIFRIGLGFEGRWVLLYHDCELSGDVNYLKSVKVRIHLA